MPPVPRPYNAAPDLIEAAGRQTAGALIARQPGDAKGGTGWWGGLQNAANFTANDQDVLRIADEIHRAAHDLTTLAGIRAYALSTIPTVTAVGPGAWLLAGMIGHVNAAEHPET